MKYSLENAFHPLLNLKNKINRSKKHHQTDFEEVSLYDDQNIDTLSWPDTPNGSYDKKMLVPFIKNGLHYYIDNIQTKIKLLKIHDLILPITINDEEYENSYVCSPFGYYISYAQQSLDVIQNKIAQTFINHLLRRLGKLLRWGKINKVIMVNNWPFSTNLYPSLSESQMQQITCYLKYHFPHHSIVFRSIDPYLNHHCYQTLKKIGFQLIASREIYFTNTKDSSVFETRLFKSDLKLLEKSHYEVVDIESVSQTECERILNLYHSLYINKHSNLNPKLNTHFVQFAIDQGMMQFKALKKDNSIDGVVGYIHRYDTLYSPFFGYDRTKSKDLGLYRLLSTVLMIEAKKNQVIFHQSAGASFYKKIRKAQNGLEYTAVYNKHLPYRQRLPWMILKSIINSIGTYFMKKY